MKVMFGLLLAALGPCLDDTVFVGGRETFGTLICVPDGVPIFEKEIKLGSYFVLPVNDVVIGHGLYLQRVTGLCSIIVKHFDGFQ